MDAMSDLDSLKFDDDEYYVEYDVKDFSDPKDKYFIEETTDL